MRFLHTPNIKVTLGTTTYTNENAISVKVKRVENGFDTATVELTDYMSSLYPYNVNVGTAIQIDVKDQSESAYPTNPLFKGVVRFPYFTIGKEGEPLTLKCDGSGYGFSDTVCGQEYGLASRYGAAVDTIPEILTDASRGIITKWVNKQMESATPSGFAYTTSIAALADVISYIYFPYKPCSKAIDDLCDLETAIRTYAGNKGPHWIVTTDDVFRLKELNTDTAGWHKYYNSAIATDDVKLYQGVDFAEYNFEKIGPEANYIIYYGAWRRPSNGDAWTENNWASWGVTGCTAANDSDVADHRINDYAILITPNHAVNPWTTVYPSTMNWNYDFSSFREYNVPNLNFWIKRAATADMDVRLYTAGVGSFDYTLQPGPLATAGKWYHISLPIGEFYETAGSDVWTDSGASWSDIDYVAFLGSAAINQPVHIDGLHFGDAMVCRVAYNSVNITANKLKIKVITDNTGKDDTLLSGVLGTTDTGLMARMAYAELLRNQTSSLVGWVKTPMIKDLLPGQLLQIYAKKTPAGYTVNGTEMRVTKIEHDLSMLGTFSAITLTDDITNSHPRPAYQDLNKILSATSRPEFQDRQSSSMKAGDIDIRVARLEEDYG